MCQRCSASKRVARRPDSTKPFGRKINRATASSVQPSRMHILSARAAPRLSPPPCAPAPTALPAHVQSRQSKFRSLKRGMDGGMGWAATRSGSDPPQTYRPPPCQLGCLAAPPPLASAVAPHPALPAGPPRRATPRRGLAATSSRASLWLQWWLQSPPLPLHATPRRHSTSRQATIFLMRVQRAVRRGVAWRSQQQQATQGGEHDRPDPDPAGRHGTIRQDSHFWLGAGASRSADAGGARP